MDGPMSKIRTEPLPSGIEGKRVSHVGDVRVTMGLYQLFWKSGGSSLAAIGMMPNGEWWVAPTNWVRPAEPLPIRGKGIISWKNVAAIRGLA